MNKRWKNILLICSLVFNITIVSFLGFNYLQSKSCDYNHETRPDYKWDRNNNENRKNLIREMRKDMMDTRREFFEMLKSGVPDEALNQQVELIIEKQNKMEMAIANHLIELRKSMTDEEAKKFFERETQKRNNRKTKTNRR